VISNKIRTNLLGEIASDPVRSCMGKTHDQHPHPSRKITDTPSFILEWGTDYIFLPIFSM
jgi:hypothetical protein